MMHQKWRHYMYIVRCLWVIPGLRIRGIFVRIRILQVKILKTDPDSDPDPTFKKPTFFLSRIFFLLVL